MLRRRAAAGLAAVVALCLWPARGLATLDASLSSASAVARFTAEDVGPTVTPFPDELAVALSATASESFVPAFGPWQGGFEYAATAIGSGTLRYGSATGALELDASSTPEFVLPVNPGPLPEGNFQTSQVRGVMRLRFEEDATVTGGAAGTPVTLTVNLMVESEGVLLGGHPEFPRNAIASFSGRIIDQTSGASIDQFVYNNQLITVDLATAVGRVLSIEGSLNLASEGVAGRLTGATFAPEFQGSLDAIGGLWITGPVGIGLVAASGHDYAVPVPEPGRPLLVLAAAGALLVRRALARTSARGQAAALSGARAG